jgi:uncharacterized membrane protein YhhN
MKKIGLLIFVLSTLSVLISDSIGISWLYLISKPLIVPSLLLYYFMNVEVEDRSRSAILAFVFSFLGDTLLMNPDYFIGGLIAFLIAHILFIFTYRQHQFEESENALAGLQRVRLAFPIILAATGLIIILFPSLNELKIPVIVYALVLAVMVLTALFRFGRTSPQSFWLVFIGAALFMISDSILAINKFLEPLPNAGVYIMLTYCTAQFLIAHGLIKHPHPETVRDSFVA